MKNLFRWGALFLLPVLALLLLTPDASAAALNIGAFGFALSTLGATVPSLVDWAKRTDPDGSTARVAELLTLKNSILQDIQMRAGNLPTGHQYTQRTGLPDVYFRLLNQGVPPSKSQTAQVTEQAAIMEARGQVDRDLALLNGNSAAWRSSENAPFLEAMAQKAATTIFYGNAGTDPEQFTGLSTRFSLKSAGNGSNIIDAGGTGSDNTSIWIIAHGDGFHGIFPKGSTAGLQHEDLGVQDAFDASGNRFRAYIDWYQWKLGVALPDWRNVVRIANIDVSNMVAQSSQAVIFPLLVKAFHRIADPRNTKIYMNRTIAQYLDIEARGAVSTGGQLSYDVIDGMPITRFRGMQVRTEDAILETEARVV
jgi:hypothetical protein